MEQEENIQKTFWQRTFPILRNKFILTILIFGIWIILFDQNNLIDRHSNVKKLNELKQEKEYFKKKIQEDQERMEELIADKESLEKFAREQYLMKKDNEDIFIIIEKEE